MITLTEKKRESDYVHSKEGEVGIFIEKQENKVIMLIARKKSGEYAIERKKR